MGTKEKIIKNLEGGILTVRIVAFGAFVGCIAAVVLQAWFIAALEASGFIAALLVAFGFHDRLDEAMWDLHRAASHHVKWRLDADGGFTAGDTATGVTAYAYPGSSNAERAKTFPERVAREMVDGELPGAWRADTDAMRWARLAGVFAPR